MANHRSRYIMFELEETPFGISPGLQAHGLGIRIKGVTYDDIMDNVDYFHRLFIEHKAIGFVRLHPTREQHLNILSAISGFDAEPYPNWVFDQDHSVLAQMHCEDDLAEDNEPYLNRGLVGDWHIDHPYNEYMPCATSLHMTTFKAEWGRGNTRILDLEYLYDICPQEIKDSLNDLVLIHNTGNPEGAGSVGREHPALRTHPVTGNTCLHWTGGDMEPEESIMAYKNWFSEQAGIRGYPERLENTWEWFWSEGDLLLWDNRNCAHGFMGGWKMGDRVMDKLEIGYEKPYYLNASTESTAVKPNNDHIPFVWTNGIYANSEFEEYKRTVTLFVTTGDDSILLKESLLLKDEIGDVRFNVVPVLYDENNDVFKRYRKAYLSDDVDIIGQKFLFSVNGDFAYAFNSEIDVRNDIELYIAPGSDEKAMSSVSNYIRGLLHEVPALRHAGHAWHYPDWFPKQALQFRPWEWKNLPLFNYLPDLDKPDDDMLLQQVVDIVYGAFNHKLDNKDREEFVQSVIDFLQLMIELKEHEVER
jgi:alpha-ketoglutarate-dependent taurine dioxygenase